MARPSTVAIDLDAIRKKYRLIKGSSWQGKTLAVIKANAYGHGAVPVATRLEWAEGFIGKSSCSQT